MRAWIHRRATAWLCLVAACLTSLAPARGLVLCVEEDGCISIEMMDLDAECGGCPPHESGNDEPAAAVTDGQGCPCVDISVSELRGDERTVPRAFEIRWTPAAPPPASAPVLLGARRAGLSLARLVEPPRPAAILPHIRSVVLHV